ncbi:hypothetical protein TWF281_010483 [Arthrobotrys megalospora]
MVKVAISGSSGNVAQEVYDALVATGKHEIVLLSRKDVPSEPLPPGVTQVKANYEDVDGLVKSLEGVHTVLCFIVSQMDPGNVSQKNLIDAAIKASVKRYAPSEWATSTFDYLPWYDGKAEIRKYLEEINKDNTVLEYSLFHPGLFTNYFAAPHQTAKHVFAFQLQIDFENRRAIILEGGEDGVINLLTVQDFANIVAKAVGYEGVWPIVGGIKGDEVTVGQLIALGEKIRGNNSRNPQVKPYTVGVATNSYCYKGGPFAVEKLQADDLKAGVLKSTWIPRLAHPSIPVDQVDALSQGFISGVLLAIESGAYKVNDAWNQLLPDYEITKAEEFLTDIWRGKP